VTVWYVSGDGGCTEKPSVPSGVITTSVLAVSVPPPPLTVTVTAYSPGWS